MSNTRGQYGRPPGRQLSGGHRSYAVGSQLLHVLELRQRYENASSASVQALLSSISGVGTVASAGANRWDVTMRDGASVRLAWDADSRALTVTITDRRPVPASQVPASQRYYEEILARNVDPRLTTYGAVAVGGALLGHPVHRTPPSSVGITIYHSVGDRADAVKQMAIDWTALYQALATQVGELTIDPKSSSGFHYTTQKEWDANPPDPKKVTWWKSYAMPIFRQWNKFKSEQLGTDRTVAADYIAFAERFQTNWDVYEGWKKKLDDLRAEAARQGFAVELPKAADLPTTVWADTASVVERGAGAVASAAGDTWTFIKYGAWAVLGIGAIVALSSVASNVRSGRDPAEKYMELIRQSRRSRAPRNPRSLPAREQLALPSGELAAEGA